MKERYSSMFLCVVMIATVFAVGVPMNVIAEAPTYVWVDDDFNEDTPGWGIDHFDKIQDGVKSVAEGGAVYVYAGTYYGQVLIYKTLTLEGEDKDTTIIQGPGGGYGINSRYNSGVTIKNLKIQDYFFGIYLVSSGGCTVSDNMISVSVLSGLSSYGIYLGSSGGSTISDNTVSGGYYGIRLISSSDSMLTGNKVLDCIYGIRLDSCSNMLNGNTVLDCYYGIYLLFSSSSTLTGNTISAFSGSSTCAISLLESSSVTLSCNTMTRGGIVIAGSSLSNWNTHTIDDTNTVNGKPVQYYKDTVGETVPDGAGQVILAGCSNMFVENQDISDVFSGITVYSGSGNIIRWNKIDGYRGITLDYTNGNMVIGNEVSGGLTGIELFDTNDNTLTGNTVTSEYQGISLFNSDSNKVTNNTVSVAGDIYDSAIHLYRSEGNILTGNTVSANYIGIYLFYYSTGNTLTRNTIISEDYGIYLYISSGSTIIENIVTGADRGIFFYYSGSSNVITGNTVSDCDRGIYMYFTSGNSLYYNSLIDNTIQLYSPGSTNTWDDGDGNGNYWSDYEGEDLNDDGIGDTLLPHQEVDWYPLMEPWNPKYEIRELIEDIEDMELPKGVEDSLVSLLESAIISLENDNENAAVQQLEAFILLVEAYRGKKLTDEQADALIASAQEIIDDLTG